jgi:hypothetical protein
MAPDHRTTTPLRRVPIDRLRNLAPHRPSYARYFGSEHGTEYRESTEASNMLRMGIIDAHNDAGTPGGMIGVFTRLFLRFMQFVLGLTVCGLYGIDLDRARKAHVYADANWVLAVVVGGLSATIALIYFIPKVAWHKVFWPMDVVLFILWTSVFGDFGSKYIKANPENVGHGQGPGIQRMKNAVWVDLVCMLLWVVTAIWGAGIFFFQRRKTLHTGRADV